MRRWFLSTPFAVEFEGLRPCVRPLRRPCYHKVEPASVLASVEVVGTRSFHHWFYHFLFKKYKININPFSSGLCRTIMVIKSILDYRNRIKIENTFLI